MKIGIDLGGSHISVGIISENEKIIIKKETDIDLTKQNELDKKILIRDTIISLINIAIEESNIPIFLIEQIGIGIPGIIYKNKIKRCSKFNINDWNIAKELEDIYKIKVYIENDSYCATLSEKKYGKLNKFNKSIFLSIGTGIGGAYIVEDKVFPSEYGHMIIEKNGVKCHCNNYGCFENYCSMKKFKKEIIKILNLQEDTSAKQILEILKNSEETNEIKEYIDEYITYLAIGICSISNTFNPEAICIGGGFSYFEEILYNRLLEKLKFFTFQYEIPKILIASLKNDAGIIGASLINEKDI